MNSTLLWYATRATGLVALVLLSATMVLGLVTTRGVTSARWPRFAYQELHRRISLLSVLFLALHVATSVLDTYVHIGVAAVVVPFASAYKPLWVGVGAISLDAMVAVAASSLLRSHLSAGAWRGLHWLAYVSWPVAVLHSVGMGTDMRSVWALGLVGICVAAVLGAAGMRFAHRRQHVPIPDVVGVQRRAVTSVTSGVSPPW